MPIDPEPGEDLLAGPPMRYGDELLMHEGMSPLCWCHPEIIRQLDADGEPTDDIIIAHRRTDH